MKIALIENTGVDFYISRLRYALFLKSKGHRVIAIVPNDGYTQKIYEAGIETIEIDLDFRKRNLKSILDFSSRLRIIFKQERFDVIHLYRMQPNLVGSPIAYFSSRKSVTLNHITGLGVAFTDSSFKHRIMQFVIKSGYRLNAKLFGTKLIFQNEEDKKEIGKSERYIVIKGSAVNEDKFNVTIPVNNNMLSELREEYNFNNGTNLIFVSRLLKQKGLSYLIDALINYNKESVDKKVNLFIVGWIDPQNPDSFSEKEVETYSKLDRVVFLGRRGDIDQLLSISDIAVLPTFYREGTPRFLLEAMAMGKPIITTNMPGCNHLVKDSQNGVLVNPKSVEELINAFKQIIKQDLKILGKHSLQLYKKQFSEDVVYNQLLKNYKN